MSEAIEQRVNEPSKRGPQPIYDWRKLRMEYVTTQCSLREMAEKYDIPLGTIGKWSSEQHWQQDREVIQRTPAGRGRTFRYRTEDELDRTVHRLARKGLKQVSAALETADPGEHAGLSKAGDTWYRLARETSGLAPEKIPRAPLVVVMDGSERMTALDRIASQIARALEASQRIEVQALPDASAQPEENSSLLEDPICVESKDG